MAAALALAGCDDTEATATADTGVAEASDSGGTDTSAADSTPADAVAADSIAFVDCLSEEPMEDAVAEFECSAGPDDEDIGDTGPDTGDSTSEPDTADAEDGGSGPVIPFGQPCGADPCAGPEGLCVQTGAGALCSRRCVGDATCDDGWRCVYCGDQCTDGQTYQHCVPAADAADIVACKEPMAGYVGVSIPNTGSDKLLSDEPCTVTAVDTEALKVTLDCPGAPTTVSIDLEGNSAALPPALQVGVPVRVTWQEEGDTVVGPVYLIVRDAEADSLIFAYVWGMMSHPVPYQEQAPWLYAPLTFELMDTSCPLEQDECHTWMKRALKVTHGDDALTLIGPDLGSIGQGPTWQVYLAGATDTVSPWESIPCTDTVDRSIAMIITRTAD